MWTLSDVKQPRESPCPPELCHKFFQFVFPLFPVGHRTIIIIFRKELRCFPEFIIISNEMGGFKNYTIHFRLFFNKMDILHLISIGSEPNFYNY